MKLFALIFAICTTLPSLSQNIKISGIITDHQGEGLIGASVYLKENFKGSSTNLNGKYNIENIPSGNYTLVASLMGYKTDSVKISAVSSIEHNFILTETAVNLEGVEVVADRVIERTSLSNITLGKKSLQTRQALNEDPLRTMATLPGIGREGDLFSPSQIYVRGGAPDENLFLMDNNQVYFPYYFGGQKSIFNTETTESIELLTGGFSAAYGNHMSSVMNVHTRDGNFEKYSGNLSVGFYNASALIEGPIIRDKLSMLIAVRRTYLDLFLGDNASFPVTSFGDITYKFSLKLNENNKLSLSGLSSDESINFTIGEPDPGLPNKLITGAKKPLPEFTIEEFNKLKIL